MKNLFWRKLISLLGAAALLAAAAGCRAPGDGTRQDPSLQKILDAGQLILGFDGAFPPMGFTDDNGQAQGFDIDVAREVCRRMGVDLLVKGINWDEKEQELKSGSIDCIWNGFSVTPERAQVMTLSDSYMKNELILVVLSDSEIQSMRDLKGKKVGFQSGATAQDVLESSGIYPDTVPVPYSTVPELLKGLDRGEVAVALVDSVAAYYLIFSREEQQYFILPDSLGEEEFAIGFRKGDLTLRDRIQQIIGEMKADGSLGEISKKWFGSDITTVK